MKNLLAKVCIVASCVTFSAQSLNAAAAPEVEPSTTSLAASLRLTVFYGYERSAHAASFC
jgi:hypothetical protein